MVAAMKKRAGRTARPKIAAVDRTSPTSRVTRITELTVGESISECVRIDMEKGCSNTQVREAWKKLRSSLSKAVDVASNRSGNTYTTAFVQTFTDSGDILVVGAITRTK